MVPGLVPRGYITLLGAREGVGKTTLTTALAWQMTRPTGAGRFLGLEVPRAPVVYVNTDAADGQSRPVRFWLEQHRAAYPDGDMGMMHVFEPSGAGLNPEELGALEKLVSELGAALIIVDSFMGSFPGVESNRLEKALAPMLALRDLAARTGAALIVTDHLPKRAPGEKDGDRGIMGSVGKSAQARAVHLLSTVPPKDVDGRTVLKWFVEKQSFARSKYALGVEVIRTEDEDGHALSVELRPCDLPQDDGDTRGARAVMAVIAHLEASGGLQVPYADLVSVAVEKGNLRERAAKEATRKALGILGQRVEEVKLPFRGAPKVHRLKDVVPQCLKSENDVPDGKIFEAVPFALNEDLASNAEKEDEVLTW